MAKNTEKVIEAVEDAAKALESESSEDKVSANDTEMVDFYADFVPGHLENDIRIVHNGKAITVKRGVSVKIPITHKKVYDRSQRLLKEAANRARARQEAYRKA